MAAPIGAVASIGGLTQFLSGLSRIGTGFATAGASAQGFGSALEASTGGFQAFNTGVASVAAGVNTVTTSVTLATAPVRAFGGVLGEVASGAGEFGSKVGQAIGQATEAATTLGVTGVIGVSAFGAALTTAAAASVTAAAQFEQQLNQTRAITKLSAADITSLGEAVKATTRTFAISTDDVNRLGLELARSGIRATEVSKDLLELGAALQKLSLGEFTGEGVGQALGSLITLFQDDFVQAGNSATAAGRRVADTITAIANESRAAGPEVVSGLVKAGPVLAQFNASIEETGAALGVILQAGIRGEEAGTALRNMFQFLTNPSREAQEALNFINERFGVTLSLFDQAGRVRPMRDVFDDLATVFDKTRREALGVSDAVANQLLATLFQTRAQNAARIISSGVENYDALLEKIGETNTVQQALELNKSLIESLGLLGNEAKLAGIAFGTAFLPGLKQATDAVKGFLQQNNQGQLGAQAIGKGALSLFTGEGFEEAAAEIENSFGQVASKIFEELVAGSEKVKGALSPLGDAFGRLGEVLGGLLLPDGLQAGIENFSTLLAGGIDLATRFTEALVENLPRFSDAIGQAIRDAQDFAGGIADILTKGEGFDALGKTIEGFQPLLQALRDNAGPLAEAFARFARAILDHQDQIIGFLSAAVGLFSSLAKHALDTATNVSNFVGLFGRAADAVARYNQALAEVSPKIGQTRAGRPAPETPLAGGGPVPVPGTGGLGASDTDQLIELVERDKVATEDLVATTNDLADSQENLAGSTQRTTGAFSTELQAAKDAADAKRKLEAANNRLVESQEDADKQFRQIQRTLASAAEAAERRWSDAMESIAESTRDALAAAEQQFQEARDAALSADVVRIFNQQRRDDFRITQEDDKRNFDRRLEDNRTFRQHQLEDNDRFFSRGQDLETREFQRGQDELSTLRQRFLDDADRQFARSQENRLRTFQQAQDRQIEALQRGFETAGTARGRIREDAQRQRDLARDLAKAKTSEEIAGINERFQEESQNIVLRRQIEDEETRIRRQQEEQLKQARQTNETSLIAFRRSQEDQEVARRRARENSDFEFRIGIEEALVDFRETLEDEAVLRRRRIQLGELIERRRIQDELERPFELGQRAEERTLSETEAAEQLARNLEQLDRRRIQAEGRALEQAARQQARAGRTFVRELGTAQRGAFESIQRIVERQADLGSDLLRQAPDIAGALASAQAVIGAQAAIAEQRARSFVSTTQSGLSGLRTTADEALDGFLADLQEIGALRIGGEIVLTPATGLMTEMSRLATSIDRLAVAISRAPTGVNIDEINITSPSPGLVPALIQSELHAEGPE